MSYWIEESHPLPVDAPTPRISRNFLVHGLSAASVVGLSVIVGARMLSGPPALAPAPVVAQQPAAPAVAATLEVPRAPVGLRVYAELLNPDYSLGATPATFMGRLPRRQDFAFDAPAASAPAAAAVPAAVSPARPAIEVAAATPDEDEVEQAFPTPPRRPAELVMLVDHPSDRALRHSAKAETVVPQAQPAGDKRGFFEKLFGGGSRSTGPALAYAAPEDGAVSGRTASPDAYTAVYDISAHTVTLPNGTRLEAHSGLGAKLDDPRHVSVRMQGPTPPHIYDLQEREKLFHGVRALRLLPVGGDGTVYGRTGLLAHTYMLGPNGQSNGCVSFRNYDAFLQAYLRGQVKRLAVVTGSSRFAWR